MKRFHVSVAVEDLDRSVAFYRSLFGQEPDFVAADYAKWMLEDPRLNFSVKVSDEERGISHVGLQADSDEELAELRARYAGAGLAGLEQGSTECCYARSSKTWLSDPDGVSWESFVTWEQQASLSSHDTACCSPADPQGASCCA